MRASSKKRTRRFAGTVALATALSLGLAGWAEAAATMVSSTVLPLRIDAREVTSATAEVQSAPLPANKPAQADVSVDLCATDGAMTLPDSTTVDIWGYVEADPDCASVAGTATVPGPRIDALAGQSVEVTVTNLLADDVSIMFPGQTVAPDRTGVPTNGIATYTFTAMAGSYLYQAGVNPQVQIPMGMFGALVVNEAGNQAYGGDTTFDVQSVLVLSEIDPAFNADPVGFDMTNWAPKYWLINGTAHPDTPDIAADPGDRVLLRYLNAGVDHHTMALLGGYQREIASESFPLPYPFDAVAETIPAGQSRDMIVAVPAGAASGDRFPLYSSNLNVTNRNAFPGGMLTFITVN